MAREGLLDDTGYDFEDYWIHERCDSCKNYRESYEDGMIFYECKSYPDCEYEVREES